MHMHMQQIVPDWLIIFIATSMTAGQGFRQSVSEFLERETGEIAFRAFPYANEA